MRIARLVTFTMGVLSKDWHGWNAKIHNLEVSSVHYWRNGDISKSLVKSEVPLKQPLVTTSTGEIAIPEEIVHQIEASIEVAANIISVFNQSKRSIKSLCTL